MTNNFSQSNMGPEETWITSGSKVSLGYPAGILTQIQMVDSADNVLFRPYMQLLA